MRVAVISANLGGYDVVAPWPAQVVSGATVDVHRLDDVNFPGRQLAMTSRLKCGIPKWFGWELLPGYDLYLWVDASRAVTPETTAWFLEHIGSADLAICLHPERKTVRAEYEFIKARLARPGETYLTSRYAGEWLDAQWAAVNKPWFIDNRLYATTAFMYRPTIAVQRAFQGVFLHKARYLLHDQLSLPYFLREHRVRVREIADDIYKLPVLPISRVKRAGAQAGLPPPPPENDRLRR